MKKRILLILIFGIFVSFGVWGKVSNPVVKIETSKGVVVVMLFQKSSPVTVSNFLTYVKEGFYDNTVFHRVIKGFMVQGGGLTVELERKTTHKPIINEADNGLKNKIGTLAMARTMDPHSATSQFFINTVTNAFLDHYGKTPQTWGYCVFGKVTKGMNIVKIIENAQTSYKKGRRDAPTIPVIIKKITIVEK